MTVFLDTNVILDVLMKREPFLQASYATLKKLLESEAEVYISASTFTDIYYLLRKALGNRQDTVLALTDLLHIVSIADVRFSDIEKALISEIDDVEDALLVEVAVRLKADLILTRNTKVFVKSSIKAMTPSQFLSQ